MPVQLFTEAERARRNRFPEVIAYEDLVTFFTLSEHDLEQMPRSVRPTTASAMRCNSVPCASWALSRTTSTDPARSGGLCRPAARRGARRPRRLWRPRAHPAGSASGQAHLGYRKVRKKDFQVLATGSWNGRWSMTNRPCCMS